MFVPAGLSSPHTIFLLRPESHTIILLIVTLYLRGRIFNWFSTQTRPALLHSPTCFFAPMKCNPSQRKTIQQFNRFKLREKISDDSIFELFSRPSVALSTKIEFPLGTTSFYLAAWCCPQLNSNGVHFTKHLTQHCMCNCVCYMHCELH